LVTKDIGPYSIVGGVPARVLKKRLKMRIAYFSSKFPYNSYFSDYACGGSVLATHSLVKEISKMGHEIKVFTTSKDSKNYVEISGNIEVHRYGTQLNLLSSNLSFGLFFEPIKYDVDLVHVSFDIPPGPFAGYMYAKKKNIPLIVTYHGDWEENYGNIIRKIGVSLNNKFLVDKILSYADVIISPSKLYIKSSKYLTNHEEKTVIIPNGINLEEFHTSYSKQECREKLDLPRDKNIILFFGYLSPYKSPDILLRSFAEVLKENPNVILLFAGSGEMEHKLQIISKELGIEQDVRFAGFIEKNLRVFYYKSSDIFCLPSTMSTECYPLAILEAMASGVPVVASEIGGIPDIIENNVNGLLVPPKDEEKLKDALILLLDNPEICEKFSETAFHGIKKYLWENIAEETEKLYTFLMENR